MSWLTKILGRDHAAQRLAEAHSERDDAANDLRATREVVGRLRRHEQDTFTRRMAAGFERREGRA